MGSQSQFFPIKKKIFCYRFVPPYLYEANGSVIRSDLAEHPLENVRKKRAAVTYM